MEQNPWEAKSHLNKKCYTGRHNVEVMNKNYANFVSKTAFRIHLDLSKGKGKGKGQVVPVLN
jgi:hypothetical protein